MSDNVIHAFGRKPGDPPPGAEKEPEKVVICEASKILLTDMLARVNAGKLRFAGLTALDERGLPIIALVAPTDEDFRDLALMNLAVDELKMQVADRVSAYCSQGVIVADDDEEPTDA